MHLMFRPPTDLLNASPTHSAHSSCMVSPSLETVPEDNNNDEKDLGYFERGLCFSPAPDSESDEESDGADSDATLEDTEIFEKIGHPLERIPRVRSFDSILSDQEFVPGIFYRPETTCSTCYSSSSESQSPMTSSLTDYQTILDDLLDGPVNPFDELDPQNFVTFDPSPATALLSLSPIPPLMIKRALRDSTEVSLLLELNLADLRQDPWNPCPHILQVVDHDPNSDYLYLCMERLTEYNTPPMSTVAQYIDFFRQILEGLSFLHEHKLVGFSCSDPNSYMIDLSSGPHSTNASSVSLISTATTSQYQVQGISTPSKPHSGRRHDHSRQYHHHHHHQQHHHQQHHLTSECFDRSKYPVRYYFVNFSRAQRIQEDAPSIRDRRASTPAPNSPSKHPLPPRQLCPFKQDVQELGVMIDRMLADVPNVVSTKFKALIKAMTIGGFGAEDSRKLFEALCRSLEASVFDMPVKCGVGLRSRSVEPLVSGSGSGSGSGSVGGPSGPSGSGSGSGSSCALANIMGDFGLEPEKVALSA